MKGLGKRIKNLRKKQNLTIVEISQKTGIDPATLSRIENEKMPGTLESHLKIAEALSIRLPELYENVLSEMAESVGQKEKNPAETFTHSSGAVAELLVAGALQKKMMPVLLKLKAEGYTEEEEYPLGTERFIYVFKGTLELRLGSEKRLLHQGESVYFAASRAHACRNPLKTETQCLSVITPVSL